MCGTRGKDLVGVLFSVFCLASILCGICTGNLGAVCQAALSGASDAVTLTVALCGGMCLWNGILHVATDSGLTDRLAKMLAPLLRLLFPDAWKKQNGQREIAAAFAANMLGIGNAATPLAIRAMETLQENNAGSDTASDDMVTFTVMSTAPVNVLPSTLLALRQAAGSQDPFAVIVPVWICSSLCCAASVLFCRLCQCFTKRRRGNHAMDIPRASGRHSGRRGCLYSNNKEEKSV